MTTSAFDELRTAFFAIGSRRDPVPDADVPALHARVYAAVEEMKRDGVLPERVILAVTKLATEAGMRSADVTTFEHLVKWCLECYHNRAIV